MSGPRPECRQGTHLVPFPSTDIGIVPTGLLNFFQLTVKNSTGAVVSSTLQPFCPDGLNPERDSPSSSPTSPYPTLCSADPFPKSLVWGVGRGWAVDPLASSCLSLPLGAGKYTATETITPAYARLLRISAADASATVKVDVVGYRSNGAPIMKAYQYFWRNGHVIGRVRAGTMGFDSAPGHNHWHFEQFAQYRLLGAAKQLVLRSGKVGFCIAPTEPVALVQPNAVLLPPNIGLTGQCGVPTALSVQEEMPVGWGDTYFQTVSGQSFNITSLPNGTYYIEIVANPFRVLRESNTSNDSSLRKIILGGTPGHQTVTGPAWHGIDPES